MPAELISCRFEDNSLNKVLVIIRKPIIGYLNSGITNITLKLGKCMIVGDCAITLWWLLIVIENIISRSAMFQLIPKTMKLMDLRKRTKVSLMTLTVLS